MAFGNPYDEPWGPEIVARHARLAQGYSRATQFLWQIPPERPLRKWSHDLYSQAKDHVAGIELGVHLHSRPDDAEAKILAAYQAGCRRFDSALTGLGGCPFAGDDLVGNIATESVLAALVSTGVQPGIDGARLAKAIEMTNEIRAKYGHGAVASEGADS